ncbi:MAG: CoxG family protein [Candidatus Tectimicrobiota bacterium]
MTFTQTCTIAASREAVWDFLMDAENVARCLAGVEAFRQLDNETFEGTLRIKVGPISLALQGTLHVEARDQVQWHGAMRAEAKDRRLGGGVQAHLSMDLRAPSAAATEMVVTLEAHMLGKIGEFGQPVIRKKADAMLQDFAAQIGKQLIA